MDSGGADWADAERQIRTAHQDGSGAKSTTVSIKAGKSAKRKAGDALQEASREAERLNDGSSKKKGKTGKKK